LGIHGWLMSMLSRMRFSLTFRISVHYAWQLMRTGLTVLILFAVIFAAAQIPSMKSTVQRISTQEPLNGIVYSAEQILDHRVTAVYTDTPYPGHYAAFKAAADGDLFTYPPILDISVPRKNGTLIVSFDVAPQIEMLLYLMAGIVLLDVLRVFYFLKNGNRLNLRVLKPIHEMTKTAETLGGGNLSNRINVAGTKNELKDLAIVINHMLDRIEVSYNSQKQFVSDASHELRTPIAVIQGYANMLQRWGKDDPQILDEGIRAISQETASMKDLVDSLLFLARHDKRTLLLEMETFDPSEVIAAVFREGEMLSPAHTFRLDALEHSLINADKKMIKQVMRILCDNAIKYTPEGGSITMSARKTSDGCILSIGDNGPGIKSEDISRIFDRFYRCDGSRKGEVSGHGLGLSIARIIVVAHKGEIKVRSKVGQGTEFQVFLPKEESSKA